MTEERKITQVLAGIAAIAQETVNDVRIIFQYEFQYNGKMILKYADYKLTVSSRGKETSRFIQLMKATLFKDRTLDEIKGEFAKIGSFNFNKLLGQSVRLELEIVYKNGTSYHNAKRVLPSIGKYKIYSDFALSRRFFDIADPDGPIDLIRKCQLRDECHAKYGIREVDSILIEVK